MYSKIDMAAITVDLKTKDLALRMDNFLLCTAFIRFRGPQALEDTYEKHGGSGGMVN
jgi:hypothetical protein